MLEKDILKIKTVLLYLLNKYSKEVDYISIFKLLYLAQKQHLKEYGIPMFKDEFYTFKAGPAPSITYNLCKIAEGKAIADNNIYEQLKPYSDSINIITKKRKEKEIKYVTTNAHADLIRLSKSNIKVLDDVYEKYNMFSSSKLSNITHDSAWEKYWDGEQTKKIPLFEIAKTLEVSDSLLEYINDNISLSGLQ
jgi:uncharacterized phage-associated protein